MESLFSSGDMKKHIDSLSLILAATVVNAASNDNDKDKPCTLRANGKYYDLNPLKATKDYDVAGYDAKETFKLNMCQHVNTELFGVHTHDPSLPDNVVQGFVRRGHGDFAIGKVNTTIQLYDHRPRLYLSDGSRCKVAGKDTQDMRASTAIDFICDSSLVGKGQPRLIAQLPPGNEEACAFVIEWRTPYACPTSEGGFVWSFFVFIAVLFLSLLLAYTVLGTLYNRFVLQLRGVDQIPQFSLESMRYHASEAWDWIKDIISSYQGGSRPSHGLYGVPNPTNPVSHQSGVGINIRREGGDLESAGGTDLKSFVRPQPRGPTNTSSAFARAPQRPETNPISHQSQVNAELEHQRVQSLSQRSPIPSQPSTPGNLSSASSSSPSSGHTGILVTVSPTPSFSEQPTAPPKPPPPATTSRPLQPAPPSARKDFEVGDDDDDDDDEDEDDEDEQDYNEYNTDPKDAKETSDFKRPGGSTSSGPPPGMNRR